MQRLDRRTDRRLAIGRLVSDSLHLQEYLETNLGKEKLMINTMFRAFWMEEDGQDMVEYALLLAFVALAAVSLLTGVKASINTIWTSVSTNLSTAAGS
jgi:Flp pilus assembly pilin Flp